MVTHQGVLLIFHENIITRFGFPTHLVSDQGKHFINNFIALLVQKFMIIQHKSTTYYPQGKFGQAKLTNKTLK
jgi:hypothetical protein